MSFNTSVLVEAFNQLNEFRACMQLIIYLIQIRSSERVRARLILQFLLKINGNGEKIIYKN